MFMTIDREALAQNNLLLTDTSDRLHNPEKQGEFINSLRFANRLQSEIALTVKAIIKAKTPESRAEIAEMILFPLSTTFTLKRLKLNTPKTFSRSIA